jgi:hypothetical protein
MAPNEDTNEPKKNEFGTGLRAQLERRREEPEAEQQPARSRTRASLRADGTTCRRRALHCDFGRRRRRATPGTRPPRRRGRTR